MEYSLLSDEQTVQLNYQHNDDNYIQAATLRLAKLEDEFMRLNSEIRTVIILALFKHLGATRYGKSTRQ